MNTATRLRTRLETVPETITANPLACQFFPTNGYSPEQCLMWAVLEVSEHDLRVGGNLAIATREWLAKEEYNWPFSFLNICHSLGLDPDYLRRGFARYGGERSNKCRVQAAEILPYGVHRCGKRARARPYRVTTYIKKKASHFLFATLAEAVAFRQEYEQQKHHKERKAA